MYSSVPAAVLVPIAVLLFLVATTVRVVANNDAIYMLLFDRYHVSEQTGISRSDLREVASTIQDYFNSDVEPLRVVVAVDGVPRELFGPAEVSHMADVKRLFRNTYRVQQDSGVFLIGALLALLLRRKGISPTIFFVVVRNAALVTLAVIAVLGVMSLIAFDPLFTLFHYLGFPQGNWQFDPRTSMLVQIFPFGFWRDVTLIVGGAVFLAAILLLSLSFLLQRRLLGARPPKPVW